MTYAPLKHLHTKFSYFLSLKTRILLIFLKTTVNSSKMVALGLNSSHLQDALPFHTRSFECFHFNKRGSLSVRKVVVVAVCLAETRGVHRCYQLLPKALIRQFIFLLSIFSFFFPSSFFVCSSLRAIFSGGCVSAFSQLIVPLRTIIQIH